MKTDVYPVDGGLYMLGKLPDKGSEKAILFVHGGALNYRSGLPVVDSFSREGILSFTMSLRGHSGSQTPRNFGETTLDDYAEDVARAVKTVKETHFVESKNLYIIAHSLGALPALKYATQENLGGLVLLAPALTKEVHGEFGDINKLYTVEPDLEDHRYEVIDLASDPEISDTFLDFFFGRPLQSNAYRDILSKEAHNTRYQFIIEGYSIPPESVKLPIMTVAGNRDDIIKKEGVAVLSTLYNTEHHVVDSSHMIMFEKSWDSTAGKILNFINNR